VHKCARFSSRDELHQDEFPPRLCLCREAVAQGSQEHLNTERQPPRRSRKEIVCVYRNGKLSCSPISPISPISVNIEYKSVNFEIARRQSRKQASAVLRNRKDRRRIAALILLASVSASIAITGCARRRFLDRIKRQKVQRFRGSPLALSAIDCDFRRAIFFRAARAARVCASVLISG